MMNKQSPNGISWTDYTWNPITGCLHGCSYCFVERMAKRFSAVSMEPSFHPERLEAPMKRKIPSKIFVVSSGDMWGAWIPKPWIMAVLGACDVALQHTFQFLTKNPRRYIDFYPLLGNAWYGTTVDGTPKTEKNCEILSSTLSARVKFISFEPLLAPVVPDLKNIDWIIIGADSNRGARKPPDEWADILIGIARKNGCAVWVKDNYRYHTRIKEFPKDALHPHT